MVPIGAIIHLGEIVSLGAIIDLRTIVHQGAYAGLAPRLMKETHAVDPKEKVAIKAEDNLQSRNIEIYTL